MKRHCQLSPTRDLGVTESCLPETEPNISRPHTGQGTGDGAESTQDVTPSLGDGETPGGKLVNCDGSDSLGLSQAETSKGMVSRVTAEERGEKTPVPGGSTGGVTGNCGTTEKKKKNESERDDFEETLTCAICQEILHDCIRYVCVCFFVLLYMSMLLTTHTQTHRHTDTHTHSC